MIVQEFAYATIVPRHGLALALWIAARLTDWLQCLASHAQHFLDRSTINLCEKTTFSFLQHEQKIKFRGVQASGAPCDSSSLWQKRHG